MNHDTETRPQAGDELDLNDLETVTGGATVDGGDKAPPKSIIAIL